MKVSGSCCRSNDNKFGIIFHSLSGQNQTIPVIKACLLVKTSFRMLTPGMFYWRMCMDGVMYYFWKRETTGILRSFISSFPQQPLVHTSSAGSIKLNADCYFIFSSRKWFVSLYSYVWSKIFSRPPLHTAPGGKSEKMGSKYSTVEFHTVLFPSLAAIIASARFLLPLPPSTHMQTMINPHM